MLKNFVCSILATVAFPALASAEVTTSADLEACVDYFTKGGVEEWIGGGLVVAVALAGVFTRWNIPSTIKAIARWGVDRKKEPE